MTRGTTTKSRSTRTAVAAAFLIVVTGLAGCDDPLTVSDPTAIVDADVSSPDGAELLRNDALRRLYTAAGLAAWWSGLFADEFIFQPNIAFEQFGLTAPEVFLDRRASQEYHDWAAASGVGGVGSYTLWQELRMRVSAVALNKLKTYARPGAREAHVAEMFATRGYAAMRLAEDFCPGFPLHDVVDYKMVAGAPLSTAQTFEYALAAFDSALVWAADSARVLNFARIGRARTLLNLGRFADAGSAVAAVPSTYTYRGEYSTTATLQGNELGITSWGVERSVADREGGTGLDFASANDPRVMIVRKGTARDGTTGLYSIGKYPNRAAAMVLASGVEARLIEAEAALKAGDPEWLSLLNQLRSTQITPALASLADPGSAEARVDLLFRERAFWLFATGSRLGDLRRLVRLYGRTSESVFPTGSYWRGNTYSSTTSLPFSADEEKFSAGVTGCTSQ